MGSTSEGGHGRALARRKVRVADAAEVAGIYGGGGVDAGAGIGASTVEFSVFYNLVFNAFAAKNASQLAVPMLQGAQGDVYPLRCSVADSDLVRQENHTCETIVGYVPVGMVPFNDGSQNFQLYATRVTSDAFEFYGVSALLGRGIEPRYIQEKKGG
jgi:hypothetical protein